MLAIKEILTLHQQKDFRLNVKRSTSGHCIASCGGARLESGMEQEVCGPDHLTVEVAGIQVHLGSQIFGVKYVVIFFPIRT